MRSDGGGETRYAKTEDGVHIAYRVVSDGPIDLVLISWLTNVERIWEWPAAARFLRRLASSSRLIILDRRGTGSSDRSIDRARLLPLEARMDDIRAVMDAAGSDRAVLLGIEGGFAVASMFAATYPKRTAGLVAYGAAAREAWAPDYPWGDTDEVWERDFVEVERHWGSLEMAASWARYVFPESVEDVEFLRHFASWMRDGGAPGDIVALLQVDRDTDVRDVLPTIGVPTLVIHRIEDRSAPIEHGRFIAEHIPGSALVELPGNVHGWPDQDDFSDAVVTFLEQLGRESAEFDRVLATVLFTDVVGSTERSAALGDRGWRELIERHHASVRGLLARYRGTEIDTAGDGFFATFDGPARAVRCAEAIVDAVRGLGLEVRTGVHTGEVETIDSKVGGIAVNIGARIGAIAGASEVLVSSTVKDLTAGSGLVFEDAGEHELKGIPDRWRLYRVATHDPPGVLV